jgi:hypothetical protein
VLSFAGVTVCECGLVGVGVVVAGVLTAGVVTAGVELVVFEVLDLCVTAR